MKLKYWHAIALIFCVLWAIYYPALFAPLNTVDDLRMVNEQLARPVVSWSDVWFPNSVTYYRPLINASFILDRFLWNLETPFLHFENILLHWINVLLVFVLAGLASRRIGFDEVKVPLVAALAFAVHPINTEAVIWIAGRADLLMTSFVLICLICTIRFLLTTRWPWLVAILLSFLAGCFAKETALFVLPGVLLLSLLLRDHIRALCRSQWITALPVFACLLATSGYFLLRSYALQERDLGLQHLARTVTASPEVGAMTIQLPSIPEWLWGNLQTAISVSGFYARKLVQPYPLNFGIIVVPAGYFWLGCLLILFGIHLLRKFSWPGSFILTAMSLGSIALLVALGDVSWTPVAERYMYAPAAMAMIGSTLAGAVALQKVQNRSWLIVVRWCLPLLFLISVAGVLQRGFVWQDNLTLFSDTVAKSPDFDLARNELAKALWENGHKSEALEIVKSTKVPDYQEASLNMALVFIEEGRLDEARTFLLNKLQSNDSSGYQTANLKWLDKVLGLLREHSEDPVQSLKYDQERLLYLQMLHQKTGDPFYLYRMGLLQVSMGNHAGAQKSFAVAHTLFSDDSPYKIPAGKFADKLLIP
jgi:tetratricopeptide (TPR) repeat protein